MAKFPFKNEPSPIQKTALKKAFQRPNYGLFHAMGAGKTFTSINVAAARFMTGKIRHVIVVVNPSAIKDVWEVELEKHCPCDYDFMIFNQGDAKKLKKRKLDIADDNTKLHFLVFGIEAFSQGKAIDHLKEFIDDFNSQGIMMIIDESTGIKNPSSTRTKKLTKQGHRVDYRMVLTGTPVTQGLQDLYAQFMFLDPKILGCKSFVLFRRKYCIMGGFQRRKVIGYQFEDDLMTRVAPYCDIVTKEEALPDLPPKQYLPDLEVSPTPEQKQAMQQLKDEFAAEDAGDTLTVSMAMERLTRFQQICGGFFPYDDVEAGEGHYKIKPISGRNPKIEVLLKDMELVHEQGEKAIIWARFVPEIELIRDSLIERFGKAAVVDFYGGTENRKESTRRFQEDPECRFLVSSIAVGAKGQTWTAATQTRYYSQTFSYEDRYQSEDRNHRRGQKNSVGYRNIVMKVQADKMISLAISKKKDVADMFTDKVGILNSMWDEV